MSNDTGVFVEYHATFTAADKAEAEKLLDGVMNAVIDVICPEDEARRQPCGWCDGTLVNPLFDEDDMDDDDDDDEEEEEFFDNTEEENIPDQWEPGKPCGFCSRTEHPGTEIPCLREHTEAAMVWDDGDWYDGEDRRNREFLIELLQTWDIDGTEAVRVRLEKALKELTQPAEEEVE